MRSLHCVCSLLVIALIGSQFPVRAADLTPATVWMTDFGKAQAEAKRLHRPLVAHFHSKACGPCRLMEKDVLHTPQVLQQLDRGFVAVKVDLDRPVNERLTRQFSIDSMPTDLMLSHDGKELKRSVGYQRGDRQKYLDALAQVDARYAKEGLRLARTDAESPRVDPPRGSGAKPAAPSTAGNGSVAGKLVPDPVEPRRIESDRGLPEAKPAVPAAPKVASVVALDGYCPVTLRTSRAWKTGSRAFAYDYDGQTFLFLAADKRDEFKANPARYAPRLYGCDPVVLGESDVPVRGSTKFGAYYDGELYLFESAESRSKFRKDPARYTRIKHAVKPDEIQDVRKLASTATR